MKLDLHKKRPKRLWKKIDRQVSDRLIEEVSGILEGGKNDVKYRTNAKLRQMTPSDETGLPGFAAVVEFGSPFLAVANK